MYLLWVFMTVFTSQLLVQSWGQWTQFKCATLSPLKFILKLFCHQCLGHTSYVFFQALQLKLCAYILLLTCVLYRVTTCMLCRVTTCVLYRMTTCMLYRVTTCMLCRVTTCPDFCRTLVKMYLKSHILKLGWMSHNQLNEHFQYKT